MKKYTVNIVVNGVEHEADVPARRMLSDFLRNDLNLTGTKRGCETGICGACSVLLDGEVVKSCLSLAVQANGRSVTTVEGLAKDGELHPVQQAFMEHGGLQCGYCTPGMMMMAVSLLNHNPSPSRDEIRHNLNGNLCRCTGYVGIIDSIAAAAEKLR